MKVAWIVSVLVFAAAVYAYCFSWHDYCLTAKGRGGIVCVYEPQIENWLATPNATGLLAMQHHVPRQLGDT